MKPLMIIVGAALLLLALPLKYSYLLPLCIILAFLTTFVRYYPERDQRRGRRVVRIKSSDHIRYRLCRWPVFLVMPRRSRG